MSNDLATLMGDESQGIVRTPMLFTPKNLQVKVRRIGEEVELTIGNADPVKFGYIEALRLGDAWTLEGHRARRESRPAELKLGTGKLLTDGRVLIQIGQWLTAKATEVKVLVGDLKKRIETR